MIYVRENALGLNRCDGFRVKLSEDTGEDWDRGVEVLRLALG